MKLRNVFVIKEEFTPSPDNKTGTTAEEVLRFIERAGRTGLTWREIQSKIVELQGQNPEEREKEYIPQDDIVADLAAGVPGGGTEGKGRAYLPDDFGRDDRSQSSMSPGRKNMYAGQRLHRGRGSTYFSQNRHNKGLALIPRFTEKFEGPDGRMRYRITKIIEPPFQPEDGRPARDLPPKQPVGPTIRRRGQNDEIA